MLQMSKVLQGRDEWKLKAVKRANEIREFRKARKRYHEKVAELNQKITALEKQIEEVKKNC